MINVLGAVNISSGLIHKFYYGLDDDEVISELDSDKNTVEPINDKDMKKFLNLVSKIKKCVSV